MLEQKNYCILSWEPLREFAGIVLLFFPQVHLLRPTLVNSQALSIRIPRYTTTDRRVKGKVSAKHFIFYVLEFLSRIILGST